MTDNSTKSRSYYCTYKFRARWSPLGDLNYDENSNLKFFRNIYDIPPQIADKGRMTITAEAAEASVEQTEVSDNNEC